MSELTGTLIQMNAHMVMRPHDIALISIALFGAVLMCLAMVMYIVAKDKRRAIIFGCSMVCFIALAVVVNNQPRVKEIKACVNGPISLESVASVYDIKNIDGKELTLWVR